MFSDILLMLPEFPWFSTSLGGGCPLPRPLQPLLVRAPIEYRVPFQINPAYNLVKLSCLVLEEI